MHNIVFILTLVGFGVVASEDSSSNLNLPCISTDFQCIKKFTMTTRSKLIGGIPALGIEPSDPFFFEEIDGDLSNLKYKFFNTTIDGFEKCLLSNLKILRNVTSLQYDLSCPKLNLRGNYKMKGQFISLLVEGESDFEIITGKYYVHVDYTLEKYQGNDGKFYLAGKNLDLKYEPLTPSTFDFKNLLCGQNCSSNAVLKFAHDNWREVAGFLQDPIWYACVKKYIRNMNKLLETIPLENYVVF